MCSCSQRAPARRGIGRLEVLVVIVVLVIVASVSVMFLLRQTQGASNANPAEQQKINRENLMAVRNNLKQLGLACQNHNDTFKTFPPLYFSADPKLKGKLNVTKVKGAYPWTVRLLPFIEEDTMYKGISKASSKFSTSSEDVKIDYNDKKQVSPAELDLGQLQSPHLGERKLRGNNNYVALSATRLPLMQNIEVVKDIGKWKTVGTEGKLNGPDGMIIPDSMARGQSMARMADGTSKTAVICESRELEKSNWYEPTQSFVCGFVPADSVAVGENFYPFFDKDKWVFNPKTGDRTALDYGPSKDDANRNYNPADGQLGRTWGPSGGHPIGTMTVHAMGDGSVLMVSTDIDPKVYFALITTRGGENLPLPDNAAIK